MRTFKIVPVNSGPDTHHLWKVVIVEEDGAENAAGIYDTMNEAEIAKGVLEQGEVDIRS